MFIRYLSLLISTTLMLFMTKVTSQRFTKNLSRFNTMLLWQSIRGSSSEKLYQELGLESFQRRRWFKTLCQFYNILKNILPRYIFNIFPTKLKVYNTRYYDNTPLLKIKHNYVRKSFFPFQ